MQATYIIPESNLPKLEQDLAKLNKRAGKLKAAPITLEVSPAYTELEYIDPNRPKLEPRWFADHELSYVATPTTEGASIYTKVVGEERTFIHGLTCQLTGRVRQWIYVTVNGETPKFAGWSLVGCLEPLTLDDGTAENIVRTVPGHTVPAEYRNRIGECDHCKSIRRRKETFVVQQEDGRCMMVGRQCIKDFLGHTDPHSLARMAELLFDLDTLCAGAEKEDWGGGGGRVPDSWSLLHYLTLTSAVIRKEGWVSRSKAQEYGKTATTNYIGFYLNPPSASSTEAYNDWKEYKAEIDVILLDPVHEQDAEKAIDWCKGLEPQESEDYLYNINLVARAGYVKDKTTGLAASIIAAYRRAMGQTEERKDRPVSQHIGKVGDKLELDVECKSIFSSEGVYGVTGIHKMFDDNGNALTWFASGGTTWLREGERFRIKGTVKNHDEYKGQKQTILTRVKILKEYDSQPHIEEIDVGAAK